MDLDQAVTSAEAYAIQAQIRELDDQMATLALRKRELATDLYKALHSQTPEHHPQPQPTWRQSARRAGRTHR